MPIPDRYTDYPVKSPPDEKTDTPPPSRKLPYQPDWLVLLMVAFFFTALLIALLFNIFEF